MSDSDAEFEKFLQESLSSSGASYLSHLSKDSSAGAPRLGRWWEKEDAPSDNELPAAAHKWLHSPTQHGEVGERLELTMPSAAVEPDSLEVGSTGPHGVSLSTSSSSSSCRAGADTLQEAEDKRRFYAQLEGTGASTVNYSDLNRQLGDTGRSRDAGNAQSASEDRSNSGSSTPTLTPSHHHSADEGKINFSLTLDQSITSPHREKRETPLLINTTPERERKSFPDLSPIHTTVHHTNIGPHSAKAQSTKPLNQAHFSNTGHKLTLVPLTNEDTPPAPSTTSSTTSSHSFRSNDSHNQDDVTALDQRGFSLTPIKSTDVIAASLPFKNPTHRSTPHTLPTPLPASTLTLSPIPTEPRTIKPHKRGDKDDQTSTVTVAVGDGFSSFPHPISERLLDAQKQVKSGDSWPLQPADSEVKTHDSPPNMEGESPKLFPNKESGRLPNMDGRNSPPALVDSDHSTTFQSKEEIISSPDRSDSAVLAKNKPPFLAVKNQNSTARPTSPSLITRPPTVAPQENFKADSGLPQSAWGDFPTDPMSQHSTGETTPTGEATPTSELDSEMAELQLALVAAGLPSIGDVDTTHSDQIERMETQRNGDIDTAASVEDTESRTKGVVNAASSVGFVGTELRGNAATIAEPFSVVEEERVATVDGERGFKRIILASPSDDKDGTTTLAGVELSLSAVGGRRGGVREVIRALTSDELTSASKELLLRRDISHKTRLQALPSTRHSGETKLKSDTQSSTQKSAPSPPRETNHPPTSSSSSSSWRRGRMVRTENPSHQQDKPLTTPDSDPLLQLDTVMAELGISPTPSGPAQPPPVETHRTATDAISAAAHYKESSSSFVDKEPKRSRSMKTTPTPVLRLPQSSAPKKTTKLSTRLQPPLKEKSGNSTRQSAGIHVDLPGKEKSENVVKKSIKRPLKQKNGVARTSLYNTRKQTASTVRSGPVLGGGQGREDQSDLSKRSSTGHVTKVTGHVTKATGHVTKATGHVTKAGAGVMTVGESEGAEGSEVTDEVREEAEQWTKAWQEQQRLQRAEEEEGSHQRELSLCHDEIASLKVEVQSLEARLESEHPRPLTSDDERGRLVREQEALLNGFQKENERLYSELAASKARLKQQASNFTAERQRLAAELLSARTRLEKQLQKTTPTIVTMETPGDDQSAARIAQLEVKLEEEEEKNRALERKAVQLEQCCHAQQSELRALSNHRHGDDASRQLEELRTQHKREVDSLTHQLYSSSANQRLLQRVTEQLKERDEEIARLKSKITSGGRGGHAPKRIKELEARVQDLQNVIQKRFPNSLSALILASSDPGPDVGVATSTEAPPPSSSYLERRVRQLEREGTEREGQSTARLQQLREKYSAMEVKYERQLSALREQLVEATPTAPPPKTSGSGSARNQDQPLPTESSQSSRNEDDLRKLSHHPSLPPPHPHHSPHPPSRQPVADHSALLLKENAALKRQLSEISFEAAHERVVLQGRLAGIEALSRRRLEEAGDTVKQLEAEHRSKVDGLKAQQERDHTHSDHAHSELVKLRSQLAAREVTVTHLKERLTLSEGDRERERATEQRCTTLEGRLTALSAQLLEAKREHTPEMHHFSALRSKVASLELRTEEFYQQLSHAHSSSHTHRKPDSSQVVEWRQRLSAKDAEVERYKTELEAILAALEALKQAGGAGHT